MRKVDGDAVRDADYVAGGPQPHTSTSANRTARCAAVRSGLLGFAGLSGVPENFT
jgi:hypothetical protein